MYFPRLIHHNDKERLIFVSLDLLTKTFRIGLPFDERIGTAYKEDNI